MKKRAYLDISVPYLLIILFVGVILACLMLYKLGSLIGGLSQVEVTATNMPVGWHGIYHHPLYLPLELVRSVDFFIFKNHGQTLTRLPNALFGVWAIISFGWLVSHWHNRRTTVLATALFGTAAWTLHVSRLASFDVLYLWATPTLVLTYTLLHRRPTLIVWYGSLVVWLSMLYIPGLVWLLPITFFLEREVLIKAWQEFGGAAQKAIYVFIALLGLPLLIIDLLRSGQFLTWLGLPAHFPPLLTVLKHFAAVPVHLFIRGPEYPYLWLGRAPVMDIFTLAACLIGIYFYARHWKAIRTRLLLSIGLIGWVLVGLGGPVGLSLLVPLLYMAAATGIAYLLHEWLRTFPSNPLARGLGVGVILLAVTLSCVYNLRAYYVAWPHNQASRVAFPYHRQR